MGERDARTAMGSRKTEEIVDPRWLLKALLGVLGAAVLFGYLTICGLFYRGQWQLVLHPSRTSEVPRVLDGTTVEEVHFAPDATGTPQLTGWWLPARIDGRFRHLTVLYLPAGEGSLATHASAVAQFHALGIAVFALDYRGFGQSAAIHPSEQSMTEDAESAWRYLTGLRAVRMDRLIPYGAGLGSAMALHIADLERSAPAVVLDAPEFDVRARVRGDSRSRLVPVGLLFHNDFALRPTLDTLRTPKLILTRGSTENQSVLAAADPKMTVALPDRDAVAVWVQSVSRFLDQYAPPTPAPELVPPATPPRNQ